MVGGGVDGGDREVGEKGKVFINAEKSKIMQIS